MQLLNKTELKSAPVDPEDVLRMMDSSSGSSGGGIISDDFIDITLPYTATEAGWVLCVKRTNGSQALLTMVYSDSSKSTLIRRATNYAISGIDVVNFIFVNPTNYVEERGNVGGAWNTIHFFPLKK